VGFEPGVTVVAELAGHFTTSHSTVNHSDTGFGAGWVDIGLAIKSREAERGEYLECAGQLARGGCRATSDPDHLRIPAQTGWSERKVQASGVVDSSGVVVVTVTALRAEGAAHSSGAQHLISADGDAVLTVAVK
jgi:hypothetical protein